MYIDYRYTRTPPGALEFDSSLIFLSFSYSKQYVSLLLVTWIYGESGERGDIICATQKATIITKHVT